jgi:hypothetical protein
MFYFLCLWQVKNCVGCKKTTQTTTILHLTVSITEVCDVQNKKKNSVRQISPYPSSNRTILQKDQRKNALLWKRQKKALERYLEQAAFLHNGKAKMYKTTNGNMTLKSLCNIYLQHQQAKATSAEITIRHHAAHCQCQNRD